MASGTTTELILRENGGAILSTDAEQGASPGVQRIPRLLIVDDISDNRTVLARRFLRRGFVIVEAESGARALELIDKEDFDAVLLDVMMPDIDGIEVLKRVRTRLSSIDMPIIMVTAKSQSDDIVEALNLGANDYVTKPVDFAVAFARINVQIGRKWAVEQVQYANNALRELNEQLEMRIAARTAELVAANGDLAERTDRLVEAQRLGKVGDWSYQLGEAEVWWAPETYALLGFDPASFRPTLEAVVAGYLGDGARRVLESQADFLRSKGVQSVDVKYRRADGSIGDFVVTSKAFADAGGEATGFFGTIQDISDRKRAEGQLEQLAYYDPLTGLANRALFRREVDEVVEAPADAGGEATGFFGTIQDISDRKRAEEQLEQLAYYDPLTGLANRALFRREVDEVVKLRRNTGTPSALLLLDFDRFKEVNDSLGHAAGDELLVQAAHIFTRTIGAQHFIARLGGDEFAIIIRNCTDPSRAENLAATLIGALGKPIRLRTGAVSIGASVGMATITGADANANEVLRRVDLALHRAKEEGRGCYRTFSADMDEAIQKRVALARDLRQALATNDGLTVHYQPQIEIATGRVAGFEALTRWKHEKHGFIPPCDFIPIAERSHLICELGLRVLRNAALQARAWLDAGEPPREIAVNVSTAQILRSDFATDVERVLDAAQVPPSLICLEFTESLFADDSRSKVERALDALDRLGVTLALDDFGAAYSCLGYLTRLPFDKLKIDRVFVDGVGDSSKKEELLKGIVAIGRGLGMALVGEGAEKTEEVEILRKLGCDLVQGYVFAEPGPADEAMAFAHAFELRTCATAALLAPQAA